MMTEGLGGEDPFRLCKTSSARAQTLHSEAKSAERRGNLTTLLAYTRTSFECIPAKRLVVNSWV